MKPIFKEGDVLEIKLSQNKTAIIDSEDWDKIKMYKWCALKKKNSFYVYNSKIGGMHRIIMNCHKGDGKIVDHINGNPLDCRKLNLRFVTYSQNSTNKKGRGASKYLGVHRSYNKWSAYIKPFIGIDKSKSIYLGYFKTQEEAAKAYNEAAIKYHGEYARLNVIDSVKQPSQRLTARNLR